jgi:hypothetical protein
MMMNIWFRASEWPSNASLQKVAGAGVEPASQRSERCVLPLDNPAEVPRRGIEPRPTGSKPAMPSITLAGQKIGGQLESASAQWESNPHFRHGKAAGYRYIMGAKLHHNQIVKDQTVSLVLETTCSPLSEAGGI